MTEPTKQILNKSNDLDFERALEGIDYPASRIQLVNCARDHGGLNGNVVLLLERIPNETYNDSGMVMAAVEVALETSPDLRVREPSAASPPVPDDKAAVASPDDSASDERDAAQADAERILERNRALVAGEVSPGTEGERSVGVGRTVNSDRSHAGGDYNSD